MTNIGARGSLMSKLPLLYRFGRSVSPAPAAKPDPMLGVGLSSVRSVAESQGAAQDAAIARKNSTITLWTTIALVLMAATTLADNLLQFGFLNPSLKRVNEAVAELAEVQTRLARIEEGGKKESQEIDQALKDISLSNRELRNRILKVQNQNKQLLDSLIVKREVLSLIESVSSIEESITPKVRFNVSSCSRLLGFSDAECFVSIENIGDQEVQIEVYGVFVVPTQENIRQKRMSSSYYISGTTMRSGFILASGETWSQGFRVQKQKLKGHGLNVVFSLKLSPTIEAYKKLSTAYKSVSERVVVGDVPKAYFEIPPLKGFEDYSRIVNQCLEQTNKINPLPFLD